MLSQYFMVLTLAMLATTLTGARAGNPYAGAGVGGHAGVPAPTAFQGAAWYGRDSGAGGYAGASVVSPLAASGFGVSGGNYLAGVPFAHQGQSAGFGGFAVAGAAANSHLSASSGGYGR